LRNAFFAHYSCLRGFLTKFVIVIDSSSACCTMF